MAKRKAKAPVIQLVTICDEQRHSAIKLLRDTLAQAEAGDIEQVGIAYVRRGSVAGCAFSDCDVGALVGATALLSYRILAKQDK